MGTRFDPQGEAVDNGMGNSVFELVQPPFASDHHEVPAIGE